MSTTPLPLRPIETDLVPVLRAATGQRELTREIAGEALARGIDRVIFTGVGGSWASSVPANLLLGTSRTPFGSENINATELTDLYLDSLDEKTIVVAASHSGGTPETVEAARRAAERDCLVVSLSSVTGNSLSDAADYSLVYGSDRTITSAKYILLTEFCHSLFEAFGVTADTDVVRAGLDTLPEATLRDLLTAEPKLAEIAERYARADNLYVLAAGPMVGLAYMLSVCYLVEQQWMKSSYFLAADFFHGPFELAQGVQPYLLISGEDATRPQLDRTSNFLSRYHDDFAVLDVADLALEGLAPRARAALGHIPMAVLVARLADHFESVTGHDLDSRLYMHKVEY